MIINGFVRNEKGEAVEGARVYFISGPGPLPEIAALTAKDGAFALSVPMPGEYQIGASDGDDLAGKNIVQAIETPINVTVTIKKEKL